KAIIHRETSVPVLLRPIHRLKREIIEVEIFELLRIQSLLWHNQFQFITFSENKVRSQFRTNTDPIDAGWWKSCPIRFDRYFKTHLVKFRNQAIVHLKQRLAA